MKRSLFRNTLIISIFVHATLLLVTVWLPKIFQPLKTEIIEISYENPDMTAIRPKPSDLPIEKLQVVDQDEKAVNDEISKDAKFLSAHNQVVKKQTVATNLGDFKNRSGKDQSPGDGGKPNLKLENLKPKMDFKEIVEKKNLQERDLEQSLEKDALKYAATQKEKPQEAPSEKVGKGGSDSSQTSDYIKDLDRGMETMLSTREFVYYSFYSRIRRQLNQHWGGKVREKMTKIMKEGRSIASTDDKITKLLITLDRGGRLVKVQVLNDSGIRDLDDAAIEAFQEAAPFPNPPAGIVETDGTIKIRWDFILEA